MSDFFLMMEGAVKNQDAFFDGITTESKIIISNSFFSIDRIDIPHQITDVILVSCKSDRKVTIHCDNEKTVVWFECNNNFKDVDFSGVFSRVVLNSSRTFARISYPVEFEPSQFGTVSFLKDAKTQRLEFFSVSTKAVKCVGSIDEIVIDGLIIHEDLTVLSDKSSSASIRNFKSEELHFVGQFENISLGSHINIGTLYFDGRPKGLKNINIDLQDSNITEQLQVAYVMDSKATQFIIKNASYASIKRFVLHQSVLSCFVISNCDLTKTEVDFINCRIDDLLTEGVTWPFDIEISHNNYRKIPSLEFEQKQSVYRQLKSISQKNKDVDNFLFFRRKEYDTTLSVLSLRLTTYMSYFLTILCDLLGICRNRNLPVIEKMNHKNKISGFIMTLSNWFVLKLSSLISIHGTSLFRPLAILVVGIPVLLCIFGYYKSIEQLVSLSAYVIDPTHKLETTILGSKLIINPVHSLIFKIFSSTLLFKIIMVFRKYSLSI